MANKLLEAYSKRLAVSESVYAESHEGAKLPESRKMLIATLLNNTSRYMNEAFANSVGTQRADLGMFKRFCLNLVNVAVPNLIAPELVLTEAMTAITGVIAYIKYTAGSNKGQTKKGEVFNDPFRLGKVDSTYTSNSVVETAAGAELVPAWGDIVKSKFEGVEYDGIKIAKDTNVRSGINLSSGKFTGLAEGDRVAYQYNNEDIPQNDLPVVNAEMDHIALMAKMRRVAVYYSQVAAFQAKTDYGFDLGDQLAEKACGQLTYEIDTEVVELLVELAKSGDNATQTVKFNERLPHGVGWEEHFAGFNKTIEEAKHIVYQRTKRFAPNYMVCGSYVLTIISFLRGWKAASIKSVNGPYLAGTLNGLKVFVSPAIEPKEFILGVNGDDHMSSAAVYAPYMPIVPTQLLGYADGGMSQGFSTMYDLKPLNASLVVAGKIVDEAYPQA